MRWLLRAVADAVAQRTGLSWTFQSLKLLAESPKRKKSTPRDLQTTAISQFSTVEQFLTPTTPSAPQTMFATPKHRRCGYPHCGRCADGHS
ncbi:hypothetical protein ACLKA6_001176 [Drosophila palustris]